MSNFVILKKRKDFLRAARDITMISKTVMIQAARPLSAEEVKPARFGFTATKRLGKAHVRNRVKRRLRAVVRDVCVAHALNNVDYVLVGRFDTADCAYKDLRRDAVWALKKINKMITEKENPQPQEVIADVQKNLSTAD